MIRASACPAIPTSRNAGYIAEIDPPDPRSTPVKHTAPEACCCLTSNSRRGVSGNGGTVKANAGGDPMTANAPNPRETDKYGQIVRLRPSGGDDGAEAFAWDLHVLAGNPGAHSGTPCAGPGNINSGSLFNSPDGLHADSTGLVWIQTGGGGSIAGDFEGMGNNQIPAGDPETGGIRRFPNGSATPDRVAATIPAVGLLQ
ncbi:alkaline phosphatase PhoX [Cribrihabitans pelagius]|uniref:alkaline phosphatase PhoX n=1 Tax=Cribrihabitans pelagius TaxID=1765746 RepID=UPI003B5C53F5